MCGIAGGIGLDNPQSVEKMLNAQVHRGPDDHGLEIDQDNKVILGNCRLAIIDLSQAGHMPMRTTDNRVWITYNGEVYNFQVLRQELQDRGYVFHSHTDTEVILNAYLEWDVDFVARLRGMFAFAIYDRREHVAHGRTGRLFLARDHFGIKPLYWSHQDGIFLFASEIKSLLASGRVERRVDPQAVWDYLSVGAIPPPRTILKNVSALLPGHYMLVQKGHIQIAKYWDLRDAARQVPQVPSDLDEAAVELRRLMDEATRLQMVADVPVGAFLSGGIDSSAIIGLMSQHVNHPLKTFSIGFASQWKQYSELTWARLVAERFHTDHTEIIISGQFVADHFHQLIEAIDQPSGDGINSYFVSQATRRSVTVALSGLGGDELFAGYPQFRSLLWVERWLPNGSPTLRALEPAWNSLPGRLKNNLRLLSDESRKRFSDVRLLYTEPEKRQWSNLAANADIPLAPISSIYANWLDQTLAPVALTSYVEVSGYMNYVLLRDTDVMSMAHSLEVRVPFLDPELAAYAFRLPDSMKLVRNESKVVLKQSIRDLVPQKILSRRKMGFEFPMKDWLIDSLQTPVKDVLALPEARQIFSCAGLTHLHLPQSRSESYLRLWAPVVLIAWMHVQNCSL
jgi:asparagine synthase (glutamine-hydrolysing)